MHPRKAERGQPSNGGPLTIVRVVDHKVLRPLAQIRGQRREKRRNVGVRSLARLAMVTLLCVRGEIPIPGFLERTSELIKGEGDVYASAWPFHSRLKANLPTIYAHHVTFLLYDPGWYVSFIRRKPCRLAPE